MVGLMKSLIFSGRAGRLEFRWFAPVAVVPPLCAVAQLDWPVTAASIIGMMLVPSQSGSNAYGPNPQEVTP